MTGKVVDRNSKSKVETGGEELSPPDHPRSPALQRVDGIGNCQTSHSIYMRLESVGIVPAADLPPWNPYLHVAVAAAEKFARQESKITYDADIADFDGNEETARGSRSYLREKRESRSAAVWTWYFWTRQCQNPGELINQESSQGQRCNSFIDSFKGREAVLRS